MLYGYATGDMFPLFATYVVGELGAVVFVAVYLRFTSSRRYARGALALAVAFIVAVTVYTALAVNRKTHQTNGNVGLTLGWVTAATSCLLHASPFGTIAHVIRTRSAASIPIAMCLAACVSNRSGSLTVG